MDWPVCRGCLFLGFAQSPSQIFANRSETTDSTFRAQGKQPRPRERVAEAVHGAVESRWSPSTVIAWALANVWASTFSALRIVCEGVFHLTRHGALDPSHLQHVGSHSLHLSFVLDRVVPNSHPKVDLARMDVFPAPPSMWHRRRP